MAREIISKIDATDLALNDKLVFINRVAKVVKGGKRLRFSALVVTGDDAGHVGMGIGKATEVPEAVTKAGAVAKKHLIKVPLSGTTIPHEIKAKFGAAVVLLKPAGAGTGVIAGGSMRSVLEVAGIKDIIGKSLGSTNRINLAKATILALSQLKEPKVEIARRKPQEEAPMQEAPMQEAPMQEAPVQEAPVQEEIIENVETDTDTTLTEGATGG